MAGTCPACKGNRRIRCPACNGKGIGCSRCKGEQVKGMVTCTTCGGSGRY